MTMAYDNLRLGIYMVKNSDHKFAVFSRVIVMR